MILKCPIDGKVCKGNDCAWYSPHLQRCVVIAMVYEMTRLNDNLEAMLEAPKAATRTPLDDDSSWKLKDPRKKKHPRKRA